MVAKAPPGGDNVDFCTFVPADVGAAPERIEVVRVGAWRRPHAGLRHGRLRRAAAACAQGRAPMDSLSASAARRRSRADRGGGIPWAHMRGPARRASRRGGSRDIASARMTRPERPKTILLGACRSSATKRPRTLFSQGPPPGIADARVSYFADGLSLPRSHVAARGVRGCHAGGRAGLAMVHHLKALASGATVFAVEMPRR